jgi:hypothetical protein
MCIYIYIYIYTYKWVNAWKIQPNKLYLKKTIKVLQKFATRFGLYDHYLLKLLQKYTKMELVFKEVSPLHNFLSLM